MEEGERDDNFVQTLYQCSLCHQVRSKPFFEAAGTVAKANNLRVGEKIVINRLSVLNRKIPLEWLNLSYGAFKKRIKDLFL